MILFIAAAVVGWMVWAWGAVLLTSANTRAERQLEARLARDAELVAAYDEFVLLHGREPSVYEWWMASPPQ